MPQHYNEDKLMSDIRWGTGYYSDEDFQEQGKIIIREQLGLQALFIYFT